MNSRTNKGPGHGVPRHDNNILLGMAKGPWADHWATIQEEKGKSFSGMDIYEAAPDPPRWAKAWAKRLADSMVLLNETPLALIYAAAQKAGFAKNAETFGFYMGMEAVGHGIHWTDDGADDIKIKVPSMEFYEGAQPDLRFVNT